MQGVLHSKRLQLHIWFGWYNYNVDPILQSLNNPYFIFNLKNTLHKALNHFRVTYLMVTNYVKSMNLSKNFNFRYLIFGKIRFSQYWFTAKFVFPKTDFQQNSSFEKLIFNEIRLSKTDFQQNSSFQKLISLLSLVSVKFNPP